MLNPDIFPELNSSIVQDWVLKIIEGYPFVERALLYRGMKGENAYILVLIIPERKALIETEDPAYFAFNSFEAGFDANACLTNAFKLYGLNDNINYSCSCIEADSDKDEALLPYVVDGSNHWVRIPTQIGHLL